MKIALYNDFKGNKKIYFAINAVNEYLSKQDKWDYEFVDVEAAKPKRLVKCDIAILWGVHNKKRTAYRDKVIKYQKRRGKRVIIIETGFVKRSHYYSLSFDSFVGWGDYGKINDNDSSRLKLLNVDADSITHKKSKNGHILVCGQLPWDTVNRHINYLDWMRGTLDKLTKLTNRKIIFRHHPNIRRGKTTLDAVHSPAGVLSKHRSGPGFKKLHDYINSQPNIEYSSNMSLQDDFENAHCILAYNSTTLIDGLLYGIPFFAFNEASMIYRSGNNELKNIENPKFPDKETIKKTLNRIAFCQWNTGEIRQGLPFKQLIK